MFTGKCRKLVYVTNKGKYSVCGHAFVQMQGCVDYVYECTEKGKNYKTKEKE